MSEENKKEEKVDEKQVHKLSDDLIAVIRELLQLSILTGTNLVDHCRAVQVEIDEKTGKIIPTVEYIEAYEQMINELNDQAQQAQQEQQANTTEQEKQESN